MTSSSANGPRRVLHVIHYPFFGGPQNQVLRLAAPLRRRGWESTVVLPDEPGSALERLRSGGVSAEAITLGRIRASLDPVAQVRFLTGWVADVRRLREIIARLRIDLLTSSSAINLQGQVAGHMEGIPVVTQLLDTRAQLALRWAAMAFVTQLSDALLSTGMHVAQLHPGAVKFGDRLVPFYPPVATDVFRPADSGLARRRLGIPADAFVMGTVANLTPQKGLEWFARASGILVRRHADLHVVLLSSALATQHAYGGSVTQELADAGLLQSTKFHWSDPGEDVAALLTALDVFLLTSVPRSEGISTTVLEAMSAGIPVVATDVGGLSEVVEEGLTGLLVPPLDSGAIVHAVDQLRADRILRGRMAAEGRRRALERYDAEYCADAYVRAFELATRRSSARGSRNR
ncbi:MAG TPA: glycosyltransferase family 4 protein [Candidatus Limnocylindria bacterium]|jgi:glycosyltransferase involved in cell wall biosynthesis|nr:glycosyltransferase family 4 protein [Candidatus Limnocylindria bacterium]HEX3287762.1 glycosyltransferase family 4 protein [Mycobacterium sp.]